MENLLSVIEILKHQQPDPKIVTQRFSDLEYKEIVWSDSSNDEFHIAESDIAVDKGKIAWFQYSDQADFLLNIYENGNLFSWIPITYNPIFGCMCYLLEWYKDHLLFIYREKHDIYICSVKDQNVKHFNFHGEEIERKGDLISYETYQNKLADKVRLIRIPELIESDSIAKTEAEKLGLLPKGLNRPGRFLGYK
ncbi:MAG TPA: hypothetical protein VL651_11380 [Bacteroidia bacterium]|jgi:hypothetical protein|nr:hypothetical protein [Bacteroidia bacterium]